MSFSLSGAPPLGGPQLSRSTQPRLDLDRPVSPEETYSFDEDEDDLYPPPTGSTKKPKVDVRSDSSAGAKKGKKDKKDKKDKKEKKEKKEKKGDKRSDSSSGKPPLAGRPSTASAAPYNPSLGQPAHTVTSDPADDGYSDDEFDDEAAMPSVIDRHQPTPTPQTTQPNQQVVLQQQLEEMKRREEELEAKQRAIRDHEEQLKRREREEQERKMREWNQQEEARRRAEAERQSTPAAPPTAATSAPAIAPDASVAGQQQSTTATIPPQLVNEQLLALLQATQQQQQQAASTSKGSKAVAAKSDGESDGQHSKDGAAFATVAGERDRRRRRERERARDQRQAHQEQAAHTLFQRLANEVREVFRELNLYVVASERERVRKDEQYRRDREQRDREEETERRERDAKERREREEREDRFWRAIEERETRFREQAEVRLRQEEAAREDRWRATDDEKLSRLRDDREARDDVLRTERERRDREDKHARERDQAMMQAQLEELKRQYRQQVDEMRNQSERDREHLQELQKLEIHALEKRHSEAAGLTEKHHRDQLALMDLHTANANKLEQLIGTSKAELDAAHAMHEKLTKERLEALRDREQQVDDQHALVKNMLTELSNVKEQMDRERLRMTSLYSQFEVSITGFTRENEEERRKYREAQAHLETLRGVVEKDRKAMIQEVHTERKMLEQQHEEFVERKMGAMAELQAERMAVSKERAEWTLVRERQTRDETELLTSLRHKEDTLSARVEALEHDRLSIGEMKREAAVLRDEAAHEREQLRRQRADFELEKAEVQRRIADVQRHAEETADAQARLRKEMVAERLAVAPAEGDVFARLPAPTGGRSPPHPSAFHMDLARQRAVLNRISSESKEAPF